MKDIPVADLLRAELLETKRELGRSDAARHELRAALDYSIENVAMMSEVLATLIHRRGEAGATINDTERRAAWDACWLRVTIDVLEDDDEGNSVRVSLVPPTADERKANAAEVKKRKAAENKPGLKLIDP